MIIKYIGKTDVGRVRDHNEDSYLANGTIFTSLAKGGEESIVEVELGELPLVFAVADGMGGHLGGEVASNMALELLREKLISLPEDDPIGFLNTLFLEIHREVLDMGKEIEKRGMGTTLTGCVFHKEKVFVFNIGDSRAYRIRGGYIAQLTRDHSLREETRDESIPKNYITSCIGGGSEEIKIDISDKTGIISSGDRLLLVSDGITDSLTDDDLEDCMNQEKSPDLVLNELLELSLDKGSTDNVTALLILL